MKKIISIMLAAAMLFALALPSFAADITVSGSSGDVVVKTSTTTSGGESAEKFTVTIPADTVIDWGTAQTQLVYTAEAHLGYGKTLLVNVTGSSGNNADTSMAFNNPDATDVAPLPYTITGVDEYQSDSPVVYPAVNNNLYINISENDWNTAVVGEYADTLTFIAEVV